MMPAVYDAPSMYFGVYHGDLCWCSIESISMDRTVARPLLVCVVMIHPRYKVETMYGRAYVYDRNRQMTGSIEIEDADRIVAALNMAERRNQEVRDTIKFLDRVDDAIGTYPHSLMQP